MKVKLVKIERDGLIYNLETINVRNSCMHIDVDDACVQISYNFTNPNFFIPLKHSLIFSL